MGEHCDFSWIRTHGDCGFGKDTPRLINVLSNKTSFYITGPVNNKNLSKKSKAKKRANEKFLCLVKSFWDQKRDLREIPPCFFSQALLFPGL